MKKRPGMAHFFKRDFKKLSAISPVLFIFVMAEVVKETAFVTVVVTMLPRFNVSV